MRRDPADRIGKSKACPVSLVGRREGGSEPNQSSGMRGTARTLTQPEPGQGVRQAIAAVASTTLSARRRTSRETRGLSATTEASRFSAASQAQDL